MPELCLTDDEQNVSIQVEGTPWGFDVAPSTSDTAASYPRPIQMRCIFTLEWALANDLANCLFRLMHDRRLPQPRRLIVDVEVIHDEDTAETTFCVPEDTMEIRTIRLSSRLQLICRPQPISMIGCGYQSGLADLQ